MAIRPFARRGKELTIELDRPTGPYYPGDPVHIAVTYVPRKDVSVRELRATLAAWEVHISEDSKGHRTRRTLSDQAIEQEMVAVDDMVRAGSNLTYQADWRTPLDIMPSYAGDSLRCGLSARVQVDVARSRDASESVVVPLLVPAPELRTEPGWYGDPSHPEKADMRLRLSSLEWVEGETVSGRLSVTPLEAFDAREVRVNLIRREQVHAPRLRTKAAQRVSKAKAAGKTRFEPHQRVELDFSLDVPAAGRPSRQTEHTTVAYTIEAVLSRRLRKSYKVEVEVFVYESSGLHKAVLPSQRAW